MEKGISVDIANYADEDDESAKIVPDDIFWHVEASLNNGLESGIKIEIEHEDGKYWVATIMNVFNQLLSLRWEGSSDQWFFDVKSKKCYPFGYYSNNAKYAMEPPSELKVNLKEKVVKDYLEAYSNETKFSKEAVGLIEGKSSIDYFQPESIVEVAHRFNPEKHWFCKVVKNIGGRLLLKWVKKDDLKENSFWLFYCHPRIFHMGYASEKGDISYEPTELYDSWASDIQSLLQSQGNEESRNSRHLLNISKEKRPKIISDDSLSKISINDRVLVFSTELMKVVPWTVKNKIKHCCIVSGKDGKDNTACYPHDDYLTILPSSWADENEIPIHISIEENNGDDCDWNEYLEKVNARAAPIEILTDDRIKEFSVNSKVEVVHPNDENKICEGIVIRITPPLVWVEISADTITLLPYNTTYLFPSGWCRANNYPLTKLLSSPTSRQKPANDADSENPSNAACDIPSAVVSKSESSKSWCPRIYFNHKCFTGPSLSKSKICELPRFVGPGPVLLVIQEVISKIISVAYVPSRVLNELSSKSFVELIKKNKVKKTMLVDFKAKYQKRTYRDQIPVIRISEQVEDYCRTVCSHLKCCYNLFGINLYDGDDCPSNCRGLTKSNKVLKRAIYYREKAAEAKVSAKSVKYENNSNSSSKEAISQKGRKEDASEDEKSESDENDEAPIAKSQSNNSQKYLSKNIKRLKRMRNFKNSKVDISSNKEENKSNKNESNEKEMENFEDPLQWDVKDVYNMIKKTNCSVFAPTLLEHEIDGAALMLLDKETIKTNLLSSYTRRYNKEDIIRLSAFVHNLKAKWYRSMKKTNINVKPNIYG